MRNSIFFFHLVEKFFIVPITNLLFPRTKKNFPRHSVIILKSIGRFYTLIRVYASSRPYITHLLSPSGQYTSIKSYFEARAEESTLSRAVAAAAAAELYLGCLPNGLRIAFVDYTLISYSSVHFTRTGFKSRKG